MARTKASERGYYLRREMYDLPETNLGFCIKGRRHDRIVAIAEAPSPMACPSHVAANCDNTTHEDAA